MDILLETAKAPIMPGVTSAILILIAVLYFFTTNRGVPPGPIGVPYLGVYPFLNEDNVHTKLHEYKQKYGDLFSFTSAGKLFINLGSVKAMREVYMNKSECYVDRFTDFCVLKAMMGNGATMTNGEEWKIFRKFFVQSLKHHGLFTIRDDMARPVYDSIKATIKDLQDLRGRHINVVDILTGRCCILMRKVIYGESNVSVGEIEDMNRAYGNAQSDMLGVNFLLMGPIARYYQGITRIIFAISPTCRRSMRHHRSLTKMVYTCVKRIESSMDEQNPTCLVEDYYKEKNERRRSGDPSWTYFTDERLVESILQFVGDGVLGSAVHLAHFLNILAYVPEEQQKLYEELMQVVGPHRHVILEDRMQLPYVNAFINEAIRYSAPLRFFPSIEFTKETKIRGYRIPKGSISVLNFYSAHHDEETFEDPGTFNPSRYMADSGKSKTLSPLIFGMGKRSCTGESFMNIHFFLFFASIVKNFKIVSSNAVNNKSTKFLVERGLELTFIPRVESDL